MTDSADQQTPAPADEVVEVVTDPRIIALSEVFGERFAYTFRDPMLMMDQPLSVPVTQSMYRRDFPLLSRALYLESVYRRREGYNIELLENFARMIGEKLVAVTKLFDNRTTQMMALFKSNGVKAVSVYVHTMDLHVPIIASHARNFILLLKKLDDFYQLVGCAALNGLVDSAQRRTAELEARKAVRSFTGMVRTEQAKLRKESQRLRDQRFGVAEPELQHAEDMADAAEKTYDESKEDPASAVAPEEAQAVLDSIVTNGVAAATAAGRRTKAAAAPVAAAHEIAAPALS